MVDNGQDGQRVFSSILYMGSNTSARRREKNVSRGFNHHMVCLSGALKPVATREWGGEGAERRKSSERRGNGTMTYSTA